MNETPHITSEQLAAYVSGEADAPLRAAVDHWAAEDPANAKELQALVQAWSWTAEAVPMPEVDVDAAWRNVQERSVRSSPTRRNVPIRPLWRPATWLAAAAVVAGLFVAVRILIAPSTQDLTSIAETITGVLQDSSSVVLSPHSELTASISEQRKITLQGDAYFEVKRDTARPFTVEAGDVLVTVLGTGFEVSAYDSSKTVLVRVHYGHVRVQAKGQEVDLLAGDAASYDKASGRLVRMELPSSVAWGDRILQFKEAPMAEVVRKLETMYGVQIELGNKAIGNCLLTADFDNEAIERILNVIGETFSIQVEQTSPDHYILNGDGC